MVDFYIMSHAPYLVPLIKWFTSIVGPYLHKLPKKRDDLLARTTVDVPAVHRNSPVFVVVYVVMRDGERGRSRGGRQRQTKIRKRDEVVEVLRAISSILSSEDLPEDTKNRILIQVDSYIVIKITMHLCVQYKLLFV